MCKKKTIKSIRETFYNVQHAFDDAYGGFNHILYNEENVLLVDWLYVEFKYHERAWMK